MCRVGPVGSGLPLLTPPRTKRAAGAPSAAWKNDLAAEALTVPASAGGSARQPQSVRQPGAPSVTRRIGADAARSRREAVLGSSLITPLKVGPIRLVRHGRKRRASGSTSVVCGGGPAGGAPPVDPAGRIRPTLSGATRADPKTSRSGPVPAAARIRHHRSHCPAAQPMPAVVWITPAAADRARTRRGGAFFRAANGAPAARFLRGGVRSGRPETTGRVRLPRAQR